ncbi:MAG: hypothetical protein Q8Q94_02400 [bacterium]|nr:hypothetical protein [bacterium]
MKKREYRDGTGLNVGYFFEALNVLNCISAGTGITRRNRGGENVLRSGNTTHDVQKLPLPLSNDFQ